MEVGGVRYNIHFISHIDLFIYIARDSTTLLTKRLTSVLLQMSVEFEPEIEAEVALRTRELHHLLDPLLGDQGYVKVSILLVFFLLLHDFKC